MHALEMKCPLAAYPARETERGGEREREREEGDGREGVKEYEREKRSDRGM